MHSSGGGQEPVWTVNLFQEDGAMMALRQVSNIKKILRRLGQTFAIEEDFVRTDGARPDSASIDALP
jgi:hypothetical protein